MINIKTNQEINLMRRAGELTGLAHKAVKSFVKPGVTTKYLNKIVHDFIISEGCIPSFMDSGFPTASCISINEEVVHGIPSERTLKNGDIVSIDIGVCYKGYHGDSAWTYKVGEISEEKEYLMKHTEVALFKGLEVVKPGNRIGDVSYAIGEYAKLHNLGVVKELVGHGIGNRLHEDPEVPNYGVAGTGPILKEGMCIAIEPMLNSGTSNIYLLDDDWTIVTADMHPSAHYEHTVLVTHDGYEILTKR